MSASALKTWHRLVETRQVDGLPALLADDIVFYSPVVHTPQRGRQATLAYLEAAFQVFLNDSFRYVRELRGDHEAVLEFELEIDGISINGVDMLRWNAAGELTEFKVMVRPLQAVNLLHMKMKAMLESMQAAAQ